MNFIKVVALVFLFIVRIRFPSHKSIAEIIRNRYGKDMVKLIRKFEKVDYKHRKAQLDLAFLEYCQRYNFIPNFLHFRVANKNLRSSTAYTSCQTRLLSEEITQKKSLVRQQFNELSLLKKNNLKERFT